MGQWRKAQADSQKHPRVSMAVPVRITTVDAEIDPNTGKAFFRSDEATTANLSRGGAYVRSWEPLASGRRVVVTIALPQGAELQLVGRVAWTRRELRPEAMQGIEAPGYGVEFVGGSSAELAALERHLMSLKPMFTAASKTDPNTAAPQP
jgi:hypothetical protein